MHKLWDTAFIPKNLLVAKFSHICKRYMYEDTHYSAIHNDKIKPVPQHGKEQIDSLNMMEFYL
jgi:hypothetical protein